MIQAELVYRGFEPKDEIEKIMYGRGLDAGKSGSGPNESSPAYVAGYEKGRKIFYEEERNGR